MEEMTLGEVRRRRGTSLPRVIGMFSMLDKLSALSA
jgi:hypothetical protein